MNSSVNEERQERILAAVRKGQEAALDAIKAAVGTASRVRGKVVEVKVPDVKAPLEARLHLEGRFPRLEGEFRKLEGKLPKPHELVSDAYDFAEKLLGEQRKFVDEVLKVTAALRPAARDAATGDGATTSGTTSEAVTDGVVADDAVTSDAVTSDAVASEDGPGESTAGPAAG
jgi:hypothetical protein